MNEHPTQREEPVDPRVVELETLFMHLQRTVGELDQVVLAQQKQIEALEQKFAGLEGDLNSLSGSVADERKPEDEKPPHY
jgi:uncharacterized coiled-coil protein SlyX